MTATDVRPSSIGEILDRAVATYVRRCIPLLAILAVLALPLALLQYVSQPGLTHVIETINRVAALPPGDLAGRTAILNDFNRALAPGGWLALFYAAEVLAYPLARSALVIFAAHTLDGEPATVGSAYREALPRWVPQIVVAIAFIGLSIALGFGLFFTGGLAALAVFALALLSRVAAIAFGVGLALALVAALVVAVALGYIAWLMASVSVAIEDGNPIRAIGRGLRRTFDRPLRKRTLGVALAVLAIDWFGALAFISFGALLAYLTHVGIVYAIVAAGAGVALDGLRTIFVLIYMRDVQLRREGSDLLLAAGALPQPG